MHLSHLLLSALETRETVFIFYRNNDLQPVGEFRVLRNRLNDDSPEHPSLLPEPFLLVATHEPIRRSSLVLHRNIVGEVEIYGSLLTSHGRHSLGPSNTRLAVLRDLLQGVTEPIELLQVLGEFVVNLQLDAQSERQRRELKESQFPWRQGLQPTRRRTPRRQLTA